jgi:hypothetical protein
MLLPIVLVSSIAVEFVVDSKYSDPFKNPINVGEEFLASRFSAFVKL